MIVQIYEVNSPTEARALVATGVDHIGVLIGHGIFPREVATEIAREIFKAVSGKAKRVALSLSADFEEVVRVVQETSPDIVHVGASIDLFSPEQTRSLKDKFPNVAVMRAIPVTGEEAIAWAKEYEGIADWLLLDSHKIGDTQIGAQGVTHDWNISKQIVDSVHIPVILAGGLGPDNVVEAIHVVNPAGVDSKTKTDLPNNGGKDIEKVKQFVQAAKGVT